MVEQLIRRARRRLVLNEALGQLAFAAAIGIGGLALILLVGTRWLEWWTLTFFVAAGLLAGAWRAWRAAPDAYRTAVLVDAHTGSHDTLSTALHFSGGSGPRAAAPAGKHAGEDDFRVRQREQAETLAASVDLATAVPFTLPRSLYLLAAFAAAASLLLVLRFNAAHGLDLRPPLTEVLFEDQAARPQAKSGSPYSDPARRKGLEAAESLLAKMGIPLNPNDRQPEEALSKAIDQALEGPGSPGDKGKKGPGAGGEQGKAGAGLEQSPAGDSLDGKNSSSAGSDSAESKTQASDKSQPGGEKGAPKNGEGGNSSSLMSKLKEAVSNMMGKGAQDKAGSGQKGPQQPGQQAKADKSSGDKSSGKGQEQQGGQQGDTQSGDPNGEPQDGQQAEGKAGSKSAQSSAQAGSGVGSQDGAKDIHAAEQLKAMGKISEIIGKRAATLTGETTIEVQSGNQQLRTGYSNKAATHTQSDSDVSRDEIPVGMQSYVQQYFEQVHKPVPPLAKPEAARPKAAETPLPNR